MKYLLPLLFCLSSQAATITFSWTNFDGSISTNDLITTMVRQPINDGSHTIKGLPVRFPTTNGAASRFFLTGFYSVVPYRLEVEPIIFEVPNDSQTYDFWDLRRSGGSFFTTAGVLGLRAGQGISLVPTNGVGFVTLTASGTGGAVGVLAGSNSVQVVTNVGNNLFTVSLAFLPQIASTVLSNWALINTNYFYPSNNPSGFVSSNAVPFLLGYQTNAITTNSPTGMTNVVRSIAGSAGSLSGLSDVGLSTPGNGQGLKYSNGKWTNDVVGTVTSVGLSLPSELAASGVPVTGSGTIAVTKVNQTANTVWAGPTSGSAAQPAFRALVAADIPAISTTVYASNILSGGQFPQLAIASNATVNGQFLINTNSTAQWSVNGGALTNLQSAQLVGLVPVASIGTGSGSAGTFLRGDRVWTSQLVGTLSVFGQINNTGNLLLDNGAIASDGFGTVVGTKWIGSHFGNGFGLTNVATTNLIGMLPDARISNNVPRLNIFNEWANNNQFDSSVQFNGILDIGSSSVFQGSVGIGSSFLASSNRLQVVNVGGRNLLEINTNGVTWFGTNHQLKVEWDGGIIHTGMNYNAGATVQSNGLTADKVVSYDYVGNGSHLTNFMVQFDASQFVSTTENVGPMLHFINVGTVTNLQHKGDLTIYPSSRINVNGYYFSNNIVNGELTIADNTTAPMELINNIGNYHKFNDSIVGGASSNRFTGILTANNLSVSTITNLASAGSKIQGTDANGKLIDVTDGSTLVSLNASQLSSGTVAAGRLPALGTAYADALTNNEARSPVRLLGASNHVSGIMNVANLTAGTVTNRASSGGKLAAYDVNGKLIDVGTISGGSFSGTTLTVVGGVDVTAWHTNGNTGAIDSTAFIGTTDNTPITINEGGSSFTFWPGTRANIIAHSTLSANASANTLTGTPDGMSILNGDGNNVGPNGGACAIFGEGNSISNSYKGMAFGEGILMDTKARTGVTSTRPSIGLGYNWTVQDAGVLVFGDQQQPSAGTPLKTTWISDAAYFRAQNGTYLISGGLNVGYTNKPTQGSIIATNTVVIGTTNLYAVTNVFEVDWTNGQAITVNKTNGNVAMPQNLAVGGTILATGGFGATTVPYSSLIVGYATNLFSHFADVGNSSTSDTSLYSDSVPASTLSANGMKIKAQYGLSLVSSATATRQVKLFFGGTSILDTGALVYAATGTMDVEALIIRDSSTSIRYKVRATATGGTVTNFVSVGKLTGLTLSAANTVELHGQAGSTGAASNDIVATLGNVTFEP